ncbi:MAG: M28 family peptidase [Thermoplasmatota archaeon]
MRWLAALLVVVLAACATPRPVTPPAPAAPILFSGAAAMQFVTGLAWKGDAPQLRIPGTASHDEAGRWLWHEMQVPGWQAHWQNFTGLDYRRLNKGEVAGYATPSPYSGCSQADYDAVANRTFQNLYAVYRSQNASGHLLLMAAHWDSQPRSDMDPNPARRSEPDPAANDGASGVGVLLELMRSLQNASLPFDVGVFLTDGEDGFYACYPLAGTLEFVQNETTARLSDRFLLLDMVGDPHAAFVREGHSVTADPNLVDVLWRHGQAIAGPDRFTNRTTTVEDDHVAFIQAGIPAVDVVDNGRPGTEGDMGFPPYWDTTNDTLANLSPGMLGAVGETLVATLQDPGLEAWPGHLSQ